MKTFKSGTEIRCPSCEKVIAVANTDILPGTKILVSYFDFKDDDNPMHRPMRSLCCNTVYAKQTMEFGCQLYTNMGWL